MAYTYHDAYLARFCTPEQEAKAIAEVNGLGYAFSDAWVETLAVLQCYINVCLFNQADQEDLFSEKLKNYTKEYERQLALAKAATPDDYGNPPALMSIPLERN